MKNNEIIKYALANALWTVLYVILIGSLLNNGSILFGTGEKALIPVIMLLLFVFSATLCAALILGRPLLWYLDGMKKEALRLFGYTLVVFFVATVIMLTVLYAIK